MNLLLPVIIVFLITFAIFGVVDMIRQINKIDDKINPVGQRIWVNLERNPIGVQYELWCWSSYMNNAPLPNAVPLRRILDKSKLQTPELLRKQIKELVNE